MQTINWYYKRLKAMSPAEVIWRMKSVISNRIDRLLVECRQKPRDISVFMDGKYSDINPGFHICNIPTGQSRFAQGENQSYQLLLERAGKIADHYLSFFDLKDKYLGETIIWNRDYKLGTDTPVIFSSLIDYRDIEEAGDCKFVWEPNRHHQLVVLGRAFRLSGDKRFAQAVTDQLDSWLRQNPYGMGMNWRSGLELGIRLINWVWAIDLIRESGVISDELNTRLMDSVSRHIWEIDRKYSRGSSSNNHLIGEAAGVFVASSYFKNLKYSSKWREKSRQILNREILNQTYQDGGTKEQALGYHFFVLQFFTIAGIIARVTGDDMSPLYWSRLGKMYEFLGSIFEGGGNLPVFGDCDDGYVLDIGNNPHDIRQWFAIGAVLFNRSDFKMWADNCTESLEWMPIESVHKNFSSIQIQQRKLIGSKAFNETGYYLLQCGNRDSPDCISVVFDCGPLGMGALAAHGHADALSFTLRAFGRDILVDPGTYDYFTYPACRQYFRSTKAHNTIVIDEQNQSEISGLFLWGRKANAKCLDWRPDDFGGVVIGEHDGYSNLHDPVIHRRSIELDGQKKQVIVRDEIVCKEEHKIDIYFHLSEFCAIIKKSENNFLIDTGKGTINLKLDRNLIAEVFYGSENPLSGWISRGYHHKQPCNAITGRTVHKGSIIFESVIELGQ
jgi:hypothetical protein